MDAGEPLNRRPQYGAVAIALYCAFRSDHLVVAWRHSPFDRLSWIALSVWLIPLFQVWVTRPELFLLGRLNHWLLGGALLASLLGTMASMNAIKYLGLALAIVAMVRWRGAHAVWFVGAASWMPAFGYFVAKLVPAGPPANLWIVLAARVLVAAATVVCLWKLSPIRKPRGG